ncbi:hypothetical protein EJ02DRAFT_181143 [Clathrospora elynae]|uniref:Uncharacterized protein n=1 Tax=Clathrospora elynae TaxID=706981 RepID=A0A6A5SNG9_9PLEO|nr:hypothetical protein EJ02DRAFT_181143 [Clathrospora elynae]
MHAGIAHPYWARRYYVALFSFRISALRRHMPISSSLFNIRVPFSCLFSLSSPKASCGANAVFLYILSFQRALLEPSLRPKIFMYFRFLSSLPVNHETMNHEYNEAWEVFALFNRFAIDHSFICYLVACSPRSATDGIA